MLCLLHQALLLLQCFLSPRVEASIQSFEVSGKAPTPGAQRPVLVTSQHRTASTLLDAKFETNPLDGECDTRVSLGARPLEIIYDAVSLGDTFG